MSDNEAGWFAGQIIDTFELELFGLSPREPALSVAQWLSERGAGHLMLVGRSGAASPAQEEALAP